MSFIGNIIRRFRSSRRVTWLRHKGETAVIPGFERVSVVDTFRGFRKQIKDDNIIERASAISYNFFMAIPPTLIFLFTLVPVVLGLFPTDIDFRAQMEAQIGTLVISIIPAKKNYEPILEFIFNIINRPRTDLLSIGIFLSLFFSSNAIMGLMRSFDKDLPGFIKRKGLQKRGNALRVTLGLDFLFILCIVLLAAQGSVLKWFGIEQQWLINLISSTRWILIFLLFLTIVSYIYRAVPSVNKKWPWITPGAIFATFFMVVLALGFSLWVSSFNNFNKLYGSLGTVLLVLVYIFINSLILLIGFEINVSIRSNALRREASKEDAFAEDVLI
ncbi:YihY/virulence factor BrkB family protein [Niabella beijingensis]|uniref:YihY/virulence factor BrkB family protein n=1 Tax=Niabella beijingensis TaxID=2872700 RepID=UPI001CBEBA3B|nr:YihY/virulence factor BrkB family protein [Niabella beijingensis]MBZ4191753.1 YihY/virulence factor BrkB family protein [Niabella beijingensis]